MKIYEYDLDKLMIEKCSNIVRSKEDIVLILLETLSYVLMGGYNDFENMGKVIIRIDKMSRVIYSFENKIFSFNFPFQIIEESEQIIIKNKYDFCDIDSLILSVLISIYTKQKKDDFPYEDFLLYIFEEIENLSDEGRKRVISTYKTLEKFEPGYIRYDYDKKNEHGKIHPLNHIDIFYSDSNTFKIGLNSQMEINNFIELIDITKDCLFIK